MDEPQRAGLYAEAQDLMPDWSQKLPEPIAVPGRKLRTLSDVRDFMLSLPPEMQEQPSCQHLAKVVLDVAEGRGKSNPSWLC